VKKESERSSNFELLRIISMVIIILSHYSYHGGILFQNLSLNQILAQFMKIGGKLGVTCYVLISAYFLVDTKFKFKDILKISLQVIFYSILIFSVICIYKPSIFNVKYAIKSVLSIFYSNYWFATAYIGMYAVMPITNYLINHMTERMHRKLIIVLTIILSIIPFIFVGSNLFYSNLIWFIFLYFIGGYIKKYSIGKIETNRVRIFVMSIICILCSSLFMVILGQKHSIFLRGAYIFSKINSPVMLLGSISMFLIFKNINIGKNKYINYIASSTFGVYLLHDNNISSDIMWLDLFKAKLFYNTNALIFLLHVTSVVMILFVVVMIIEIPRKKAEKYVLNFKWMNYICNRIDSWYVL